MRYVDLAPKLFDNGWRNVIPLTLGKGTRVKWGEVQHNEMTDATLEYFCSEYPNAPRIGMVFGSARALVGIDIDLTDPKKNAIACDLADLHLPQTEFIRIGKPPKRFLLYRGNVQSRKYLGMHIEVFGTSGQFAAFGIHPGTGRPYVWPDCSPEDASPVDLPHVTQEQVDCFIHACAEALGLTRNTSSRDGVPLTTFADEFERLKIDRQLDGLAGARRQLQNIGKGRRHVTLLSVTGWLVAKGYDVDEIVTIIDENFPKDLRTEQFRNVSQVAAQMAHSAIEKYGDIDWSLK